MSKIYAEVKKWKIVTIWNFFSLALGFLTRQEISFLAEIVTEIWSQTHKNPFKTHIEALKIQNFLGGGGGRPPNP